MYLVRSIVEQGNGHMELDSDEQETAFDLFPQGVRMIKSSHSGR